MPFYEEFSRYEGVKKIIRIMVNLTKMEPAVVVKSIVEKDPEEKARVDFMVQHIQLMESVNSSAFDREILKTAKPAENAFALPQSNAEKELLNEIFRSLQTVTQGNSLRVIYDVRRRRRRFSPTSFKLFLFCSSILTPRAVHASCSLPRPTVRIGRCA